ncbi:NmrA domain-containing protein [Mycena sanguinolenta]|uniref:NmrA domain-containing protein n=1 Tax=Mycena sanguinolenta TaxID=230812 RepID=A0A8H7CUX5_9AGAR|nr:NmrA domain-containing protein [Mycena sanguinolenta]
MSTYKSFAVAGAGTVGLPILKALAAKSVPVILLSRAGSSAKTVPSGVQVVQVDFGDATAVATVLKEHKVDVVLSTLGVTAVAAQKTLIDAAKLAAVKLFVPSEYGFPTDGYTEGPVAAKNEIAAYLKSLNIPSTRIYNGGFIEYIPWLVDYENGGKIKIIGKGDVPVSFTSIADVAGFVAYVLTTLPPSELEDRILRLEGERSTLKDLAAQFKTSVEHVDSITSENGAFKATVQRMLESGAGSTGWDVVVQVDLGDAAAIAAVFQEHKVDVVISATLVTVQKPSVDGAKIAAAKLFLPSEYGFPTEGHPESALGTKSEVAAYLRSVNIPSLEYTQLTGSQIGVFTEYIPRIDDYENGGKFKVIDRGHVPVSFTSLVDVASFIAHILTTLPPTALEDRILRLEGDRSSLNDLAVLFKTSVEHVDSITSNHGELKTFLHGISNTGGGSSGRMW